MHRASDCVKHLLLHHRQAVACCRVVQYARYVDTLENAEAEPGCEQCSDNRLLLERAWQVVSSEYFDAHGDFSQSKWIAALQQTLQVVPPACCAQQCIPAAATNWHASCLGGCDHQSDSVPNAGAAPCHICLLSHAVQQCLDCTARCLHMACPCIYVSCKILVRSWQDAGGCLHNKRELYASAQHMLQTLHDKYSEFLPPAQVCCPAFPKLLTHLSHLHLCSQSALPALGHARVTAPS